MPRNRAPGVEGNFTLYFHLQSSISTKAVQRRSSSGLVSPSCDISRAGPGCCRQRRSSHAFLRSPGPPLLGRSRQLMHLSQSFRWQLTHMPHRLSGAERPFAAGGAAAGRLYPVRAPPLGVELLRLAKLQALATTATAAAAAAPAAAVAAAAAAAAATAGIAALEHLARWDAVAVSRWGGPSGHRGGHRGALGRAIGEGQLGRAIGEGHWGGPIGEGQLGLFLSLTHSANTSHTPHHSYT